MCCYVRFVDSLGVESNPAHPCNVAEPEILLRSKGVEFFLLPPRPPSLSGRMQRLQPTSQVQFYARSKVELNKLRTLRPQPPGVRICQHHRPVKSRPWVPVAS